MGEIINEMVRKELVWYKKIWRWLFPKKNMLTEKKLEDIFNELNKI